MVEIDLQKDTDPVVENFVDNHDNKFEDHENEIANEDKMEEIQVSDKSGWLGPEDGEAEEEEQPHCDMAMMRSDDQERDSVNESRMKEKTPDFQPESKQSQHVKTSAVTRVGLQELLEVVDEKLVQMTRSNSPHRG
ncbi:Serine hydroxymethyltransferase [Bienertia sinuspersici]